MSATFLALNKCCQKIVLTTVSFNKLQNIRTNEDKLIKEQPESKS